MKARLLVAHLGPPFSSPAISTSYCALWFLAIRFESLFLSAVEYSFNQPAKPRY
jgi:hypothetical protein